MPPQAFGPRQPFAVSSIYFLEKAKNNIWTQPILSTIYAKRGKRSTYRNHRNKMKKQIPQPLTPYYPLK